MHFYCGDAAQRREIFGGHFVAASEILDHAAITYKGLPTRFAVDMGELRKVLHDAPELHAESGHEAVGLLDRRQPAEGGHLIEQEQDRLFWLLADVAGVDGDRLLNQHAQPAIEGR